MVKRSGIGVLGGASERLQGHAAGPRGPRSALEPSGPLRQRDRRQDDEFDQAAVLLDWQLHVAVQRDRAGACPWDRLPHLRVELDPRVVERV